MYFFGILIIAKCSSSTHCAWKLSIVSLRKSSSQNCPRTRHLSFRIKRNSTIRGATRAIVSQTLGNLINTKCGVKIGVGVADVFADNKSIFVVIPLHIDHRRVGSLDEVILHIAYRLGKLRTSYIEKSRCSRSTSLVVSNGPSSSSQGQLLG